jgi:ATP-dependent Clp protease ATP-binding subunit ClpA
MKYEQVKDKVMDSLKEFFRPEFLNRLDDIVLFNILSPEACMRYRAHAGGDRREAS